MKFDPMFGNRSVLKFSKLWLSQFFAVVVNILQRTRRERLRLAAPKVLFMILLNSSGRSKLK
ncbi:hypothetical protein A2U01_0035712, partial [Trifolium medium]|nr:hypothetical protein [Trifolium medium]